MKHVDESGDGSEVELYISESLEITLSENATTGYRWTLPEDTSQWTPVLRKTDETPGAPGTQPGAPGFRRMRFEAVAEGKADLRLEYRRTWERQASPARTFTLHVRIPPRTTTPGQ